MLPSRLPYLPLMACLVLGSCAVMAADTPAPPAPAAEVVSSAPATTGTAAATAPDATLKMWVKALRSNDLMAFFQALPKQSRADLVQVWNVQSTTPDPAGDRQITGALGMLLGSNAVDLLVARVEPELAVINIQDLVMALQQAGGFLALAGSQTKAPSSGATLDYLALQSLVSDVATWLPTAGIADPVKLRKAVEHIVLGAKALSVQNALELRALKAEDVVLRLGPALTELKAALLLYGLDANALLDSVAFTVLDGTGDQRHLTVAFSAFGHTHTIPVTVVLQNGAWQLAEGKDSPFAPLSQLLMLGMLMNVGSDALTPAGQAPHAAPAPHPAPAPTQPPL